MRAAKFCKENLKVSGTVEAIDILKKDYENLVEVHIVDCFKRCLNCRATPFCRIQLTTIEAGNSRILVDKLLEYINH